jgi:replication initiation and membrane attachment protein
MKTHWKEVLPVDRYIVQIKGMLHGHDTKILTSLYQPLIGAGALSLYLTLWNELDGNQIHSNETTHQSLMNMTQMKLSEIYIERKKLEGIGLLKTYKKEVDQYRLFAYELQPPLDPEHFFADDVLNIYLYSRLGKQKFIEIRKKFLKTIPDYVDYEAVTASFNEAFESVHQSELMTKKHSEVDETIKLQANEQFIQREDAQDLNFYSDTFDFDLLLQDLKAFILPKELITKDIKESIVRLAFVYSIDPLEMSSIIQQAYMNNGELTISSLRKAVQDWYKFEYPNEMPALSERTQPIQNQTMGDKEPKTPQEKVLKLFETISPRQLLERYSDGSKPAAADLKLIESIMLDQKLTPGVTNVLIDYVLITNDMKLIQSYVEKIASHWKRKNITTVAEAMVLAKSEHQKYQGWTTNKAKTKSSAGRPKKNVRKDKLPKWMDNATLKDNKSSTNQPSQENKAQDTHKNDQTKIWLEDYLKDL